MDKRYKGSWTAMENSGKADFEAVEDFEREYDAGLVERLVAQLKLLGEEWTP